MELFGAQNVKLNPQLNECLPYIQYQFGVPILRRITTIVLIGLICNFVMTVIYFILNWNIHHFIRIAHTQCCGVFAAISLYMGLTTIDLSHEMEELHKILWPYNELGSKVSERITKKKKLLQITRVIMTVYCLLIGCICVPLSGDNGESTIFYFIKEDMVMPSIINLALSIMAVLLKLYLSYGIISMNFATLYAINDVTSYMLMLRKKMQLISKLYGEEDENYYDESYQKNVNEMLRNCIDQHKIILKYAKMLKINMQKSVPMVTMLGILLLAFLYIKAKMERGIRFIVNCLLTQVVTIILTYSYSNSGQLLMDECENLHRDLCQCPWILWNKSNKVNYQIFLLNSREEVVISSLGLTLNNKIIVLISQRVLSFMAFVEQVTTKP